MAKIYGAINFSFAAIHILINSKDTPIALNDVYRDAFRGDFFAEKPEGEKLFNLFLRKE